MTRNYVLGNLDPEGQNVGNAWCSALYPVWPRSMTPITSVPESGFDVRFEVQASLERPRASYQARLVINNAGREENVPNVRPPCFSGTVNDLIYWSEPSNEFIFRVGAGGYAAGDTLEIFGLLELIAADRSCTVLARCAPLLVVRCELENV